MCVFCFGVFPRLERFTYRATDGAEDDGVGVFRGSESFVGERFTGGVDGALFCFPECERLVCALGGLSIGSLLLLLEGAPGS